MLNDRRTVRFDRNCPSPTIDEPAREITKGYVCRCHGTFEHGLFRRHTTPEHTEGDRLRPSSPVPAPVVYRRRVSRRNQCSSKTNPSRLIAVEVITTTNNFRDTWQSEVCKSHRRSVNTIHRVVSQVLLAVTVMLGTATSASGK